MVVVDGHSQKSSEAAAEVAVRAYPSDSLLPAAVHPVKVQPADHSQSSVPARARSCAVEVSPFAAAGPFEADRPARAGGSWTMKMAQVEFAEQLQ